MHEIQFQLLACQVSLQFEDPDLRDQLAYIAVAAAQALTPTKQLAYTITGCGTYTICESGDLLGEVGSMEDVVYVIYRRIYQRTLTRYAMAGWIVLHGGLASIAGRRCLFLGDKGAGKTTLMTHLMLAGHQFEGDELVLVRRGTAMACPRRLHLKPGFTTLAPELAATEGSLPGSRGNDQIIRALDPTDLGYEWAIPAGAPDEIIWISPNHGGASTLQPLPVFAILQHLLKSDMGWGTTRSRLVEYASGLSARGGLELTLGNPGEALTLLEKHAAVDAR
ncbi:MAG: hypothetical protein HOC23_07760 [Halieaceae bacterium]|nr:hypothetical protein [Halieaceae bacterium]